MPAVVLFTSCAIIRITFSYAFFSAFAEVLHSLCAPHGRQSVKKLMAHGAATNSIELSGDTKAFDRVARKWNVDYAFYKTGPDKYLLFFKAGQADAITACFSEYSRKVLNKSKSRRVPIREQLRQAADQLAKEKPRKRERVKEAVREDR